MSENSKTIIRQELAKEIIKKAGEDADFKKTLMEKPHEAIARFGVQVPAEMEIKVVEESAKVVYLVLPTNPDELADEILDKVAGARPCYNCPEDTGLCTVPYSGRFDS